MSLDSSRLDVQVHFTVDEQGLVRRADEKTKERPEIAFVAKSALDQQHRFENTGKGEHLSYRDLVQIKQQFDRRFDHLSKVGKFFAKLWSRFRREGELEKNLRQKISELNPESIIGKSFFRVEAGKITRQATREGRSSLDEVATNVLNQTVDELSLTDLLYLKRVFTTKGKKFQPALDHIKSLIEAKFSLAEVDSGTFRDILAGYINTDSLYSTLSRRARENIVTYLCVRLFSEGAAKSEILTSLHEGDLGPLHKMVEACVALSTRVQKAVALPEFVRGRLSDDRPAHPSAVCLAMERVLMLEHPKQKDFKNVLAEVVKEDTQLDELRREKAKLTAQKAMATIENQEKLAQQITAIDKKIEELSSRPADTYYQKLRLHFLAKMRLHAKRIRGLPTAADRLGRMGFSEADRKKYADCVVTEGAILAFALIDHAIIRRRKGSKDESFVIVKEAENAFHIYKYDTASGALIPVDQNNIETRRFLVDKLLKSPSEDDHRMAFQELNQNFTLPHVLDLQKQRRAEQREKQSTIKSDAAIQTECSKWEELLSIQSADLMIQMAQLRVICYRHALKPDLNLSETATNLLKKLVTEERLATQTLLPDEWRTIGQLVPPAQVAAHADFLAQFAQKNPEALFYCLETEVAPGKKLSELEKSKLRVFLQSSFPRNPGAELAQLRVACALNEEARCRALLSSIGAEQTVSPIKLQAHEKQKLVHAVSSQGLPDNVVGLLRWDPSLVQDCIRSLTNVPDDQTQHTIEQLLALTNANVETPDAKIVQLEALLHLHQLDSNTKVKKRAELLLKEIGANKPSLTLYPDVRKLLAKDVTMTPSLAMKVIAWDPELVRQCTKAPLQEKAWKEMCSASFEGPNAKVVQLHLLCACYQETLPSDVQVRAAFLASCLTKETEVGLERGEIRKLKSLLAAPQFQSAREKLKFCAMAEEEEAEAASSPALAPAPEAFPPPTVEVGESTEAVQHEEAAVSGAVPHEGGVERVPGRTPATAPAVEVAASRAVPPLLDFEKELIAKGKQGQIDQELLRKMAETWGIKPYVYCPPDMLPPPYPKEANVAAMQAKIDLWQQAKKAKTEPKIPDAGDQDPVYKGIAEGLKDRGFLGLSLGKKKEHILNYKKAVGEKSREARTQFEDHQAALHGLLTVGQAAVTSLPSLDTLFVLYAQNNLQELKRWGVSEEVLPAIQDELKAMLDAKQAHQKAERLLNELNKLSKAINDEAFRAVMVDPRGPIYQAKGHPAYDTREFPQFQLYETYIDGFAEPEQIQNVRHLLDPNKNVILQQLMGSGKTFMLIPLLALSQADGDLLSIAMFPDALLQTNLNELQRSLGGAFQELVIEQPEISSDMSVEELRALYNLMQSVRERRGLLLLSPEKMHVLLNTLPQLLNTIQEARAKKAKIDALIEKKKTAPPSDVRLMEEDIQKLLKEIGAKSYEAIDIEIRKTEEKLEVISSILELFKTKGSVIGDEVDDLLKTSLQYIISVGEEKKIPERECKLFSDLVFYIQEKKDDWGVALDFIAESEGTPYLSMGVYDQKMLPGLRDKALDLLREEYRRKAQDLKPFSQGNYQRFVADWREGGAFRENPESKAFFEALPERLRTTITSDALEKDVSDAIVGYVESLRILQSHYDEFYRALVEKWDQRCDEVDEAKRVLPASVQERISSVVHAAGSSDKKCRKVLEIIQTHTSQVGSYQDQQYADQLILYVSGQSDNPIKPLFEALPSDIQREIKAIVEKNDIEPKEKQGAIAAKIRSHFDSVARLSEQSWGQFVEHIQLYLDPQWRTAEGERQVVAAQIDRDVDSLPLELRGRVRELRTVLFQTLHSALNSHCKEEYGIVPGQDKPWAVPFSGPMSPAQTQFSSSPELVIRTSMANIKQGKPPGELLATYKELVKNRAQAGGEEKFKDFCRLCHLRPHGEGETADTSSFLEIPETPDEVFFGTTFLAKVESISQDERQQKLAAMHKYNERFVLPLVTEHPDSIVSHSQKLTLAFHCFRGFTGTLWNKTTMRSWDAEFPDDIAIGDAFMKLSQKAVEEHSITLEYVGSKKNHLATLLQMATVGPVLEDGGGWLRDEEVESFARSVLKRRSDIEYVVYHNVDKKLVSLRRGQKPEPFPPAGQKDVEDPKRFTIYGKQYCVGTDIKQVPDAIAVMTLGPNMIMRDFFQIIFRLRKILANQGTKMLVDDEWVYAWARATGKISEDPRNPNYCPPDQLTAKLEELAKNLTFFDVIECFLIEEANVRMSQNQESTRSRRDNCSEEAFRKAIMDAIRQGDDAKALELYEAGIDYFVSKRGGDKPVHIPAPIDTKLRMQEEADQALEKFKKASHGHQNLESLTKQLQIDMARAVRLQDLPEKMTEQRDEDKLVRDMSRSQERRLEAKQEQAIRLGLTEDRIHELGGALSQEVDRLQALNQLSLEMSVEDLSKLRKWQQSHDEKDTAELDALLSSKLNEHPQLAESLNAEHLSKYSKTYATLLAMKAKAHAERTGCADGNALLDEAAQLLVKKELSEEERHVALAKVQEAEQKIERFAAAKASYDSARTAIESIKKAGLTAIAQDAEVKARACFDARKTQESVLQELADRCKGAKATLSLEQLGQAKEALAQADVLGLADFFTQAVEARGGAVRRLEQAKDNTDAAAECQAQKRELAAAAAKIRQGVSDEDLAALEQTAKAAEEENQKRAGTKETIQARQASIATDLPGSFAAVRDVLGQIDVAGKDVSENEAFLSDAEGMKRQYQTISGQGGELAELAHGNSAWNELVQQNAALMAQVSRAGLKDGTVQQNIDAQAAAILAMKETLARRETVLAQARVSAERAIAERKGGVLQRDRGYQRTLQGLRDAKAQCQQCATERPIGQVAVDAQISKLQEFQTRIETLEGELAVLEGLLAQGAKASLQTSPLADLQALEKEWKDDLNGLTKAEVQKAVQERTAAFELAQGLEQKTDAFTSADKTALEGFVNEIRYGLSDERLTQIHAESQAIQERLTARKQEKEAIQDKIKKIQDRSRKVAGQYSSVIARLTEISKHLDENDVEVSKSELRQIGELAKKYDALYEMQAALGREASVAYDHLKGLLTAMLSDLDSGNEAGYTTHLSAFEQEKAALPGALQSLAQEGAKAQKLIESEIAVNKVSEKLSSGSLNDIYQRRLDDLHRARQELDECVKQEVKSLGDVQQKSTDLQSGQASCLQRQKEAEETAALLEHQAGVQTEIDQAIDSMDQSAENNEDKARLELLHAELLQATTDEAIQAKRTAVYEIQTKILARNQQKVALQERLQGILDELGDKSEWAGARSLVQDALRSVHQLTSLELQAMLDKAERLKTQASELLRHQGALPSRDQDPAWGPVHQFAEELQAKLNSKNELEQSDFDLLQQKRSEVFHALLGRADVRSEVSNFIKVEKQQASRSIAQSKEYAQYEEADAHGQELYDQITELSKNRPETVEGVQAQTRQLQALLTECKEQKKKTSAQLGVVRQAVLHRIETDSLTDLQALSHELERQDFLGLSRSINEAVQEKTKLDEDLQVALTNVDRSTDGDADRSRLDECLRVIQGATTKNTLAELRNFVKECVQRNEERKAAKTELTEQLNALQKASSDFQGVQTTVQNAIDNVATLSQTELQAAILKATQLQSRYKNLLGLQELFTTRSASAYTEVRGQVQAERERLDRAEEVDEARFTALHQSIQAVEASLNECETQFVQLRQLRGENVEAFTSHGLAQELCEAHAQAGRKLTLTQEEMQQQLDAQPQSQREVVAQIARCKALAEQYAQEKAQVALTRQALIDSLVQGIQHFNLEQIDELASHDLINQLHLSEQFKQAKTARHQAIDRAQQTRDAMDESQEMASSREATSGMIHEIKGGVTDTRLSEINEALAVQQEVNEARQKERAALTQGMSELTRRSTHSGVKLRMNRALTNANTQNTADLRNELHVGELLEQQYGELKAQVDLLEGKNDASMAMVREQANRLKEQLDQGKPLDSTAIQDLADMRKKLEATVQERDAIKAQAVDEFRQAPSVQAAIFLEETESFTKYRDAFAQAEAAKSAYEEEAGKTPGNLADVEKQVAALREKLHAYRQLAQSAEVLREAYIRETVEKDVRALRGAAPTGVFGAILGFASKALGRSSSVEDVITEALKNHGANAEQVLTDAQKALLSKLDVGDLEKVQGNPISTNLKKMISHRFDQLNALGFSGFEKSYVARLTAERDRLKADLMDVNKAFSEETEAAVVQFMAKRDALIRLVREQNSTTESLAKGKPGSAVEKIQLFLENEVKNVLSTDEVTLDTIARAQAKLQSIKDHQKAQEAIAKQADDFGSEVNQEKVVAQAQGKALLATINEIKRNPGRAEELKNTLEAQHKEFLEAVAMERIEQQLTTELFTDQAKMSRTLQNFASVFKRMEGQATKQQALQEKLIQWWQQGAADMRDHVFARALSEKLRRMTEATAAQTAQELSQGLEQLKTCKLSEQQASVSLAGLETFQRALSGAAHTLNITVDLSVQAIVEQKRQLDQQRQAADTPEKMAAAIQAYTDFLAAQKVAKNGLQEAINSLLGKERDALSLKNGPLADALTGKPGVNEAKALVNTRLQAAQEAVEGGNQQTIEAAVQAMRQAEAQYTEKLSSTLSTMNLADLLSLSEAIRGGEFKAKITECIANQVRVGQEQFSSRIATLQAVWSTEAEKGFRDGLSMLNIQNAKTPAEFSALDGKIKAVEREREAYIQQREAIGQEVDSIHSQNSGVTSVLRAIRDNLSKSSIEELQAQLQHARDLEGQYGQVATVTLSGVQPFSQGGGRVLHEESSSLEEAKGNVRAQLDRGSLVDSKRLDTLRTSANQAKERVVVEDRKALERFKADVGQLESFARSLPERLRGPILEHLQSLSASAQERGMTKASFDSLQASRQDQGAQIKGAIGSLQLDEVKSVQANKSALFQQELSDRLDQCIANRKTTIEQGMAGIAGALKPAESALNTRLQNLGSRLAQAKETDEFDQLEQELNGYRQEHEIYTAARQQVAESLREMRQDTQGMEGVEVLCRHVEENLDTVAPQQLQEELKKAGTAKSQYAKLNELENTLAQAQPFSQAGRDEQTSLQQALQKQTDAKRATMGSGTLLNTSDIESLSRTVQENQSAIQRRDHESLQALGRRSEARNTFVQALGNRQLLQQQEAIAALLRGEITADSFADMLQKEQALDQAIDQAIARMTFAEVDGVLKTPLSAELRAKVEQRKRECGQEQLREVGSIQGLMKQGYQTRTKQGMAQHQRSVQEIAEKARTVESTIKKGNDATALLQALREDVQRVNSAVEQEDRKEIQRITEAVDEAERTADRHSVRVQQLLGQARDKIAQNAFGAVDDILKSVILANRRQQQYEQAIGKLHQIEEVYQNNTEAKKFFDVALSSAIRPLVEGSKIALTREDDQYSQRSIDELQREMDRLEHDMIEITTLLQRGLSNRSTEVEGQPQSAKYQKLKREEDAAWSAFDQVRLDYEKGIGFKNQGKLRDAVTLLERAHALVEAEQKKIVVSQQAVARSMQALNDEFHAKRSQQQETVDELRGEHQRVTNEIERLDRELERASERKLEELSARKGALSLEKAELEERLANAEKDSIDFQAGSTQAARKWQSILDKKMAEGADIAAFIKSREGQKQLESLRLIAGADEALATKMLLRWDEADFTVLEDFLIRINSIFISAMHVEGHSMVLKQLNTLKKALQRELAEVDTPQKVREYQLNLEALEKHLGVWRGAVVGKGERLIESSEERRLDGLLKEFSRLKGMVGDRLLSKGDWELSSFLHDKLATLKSHRPGEFAKFVARDVIEEYSRLKGELCRYMERKISGLQDESVRNDLQDLLSSISELVDQKVEELKRENQRAGRTDTGRMLEHVSDAMGQLASKINDLEVQWIRAKQAERRA